MATRPHRSILTLPLKVLKRSVPPLPPPSSALSERRLELCSVRGISELSRPLKELKETLPRADSGTWSSTLTLKVSTSIVWSGSHDFARIRTDPLKVCALTEPVTSFRLTREEKPWILCDPSTPSTITRALNTEGTRLVRRGTLMSKSVSTTLFPSVNQCQERSGRLAFTTTTLEPSLWTSSLMRSRRSRVPRRTASTTTSGRSDVVTVTRPEKLLSRSVPPGSILIVRLMCSVSSNAAVTDSVASARTPKASTYFRMGALTGSLAETFKGQAISHQPSGS